MVDSAFARQASVPHRISWRLVVSLLNPVKPVAHRLGRAYVARLVQNDADDQRPRGDNERAAEYSFALRHLAAHRQHRQIRVLDVGTGQTSWPHLLYVSGFHVTAIDNVTDYWPKGMHNRHWPVLDVDITHPNGFGQMFDAITCISVLEHIHDADEAMRHMAGHLVPQGLLVLTAPYNGLHPHDPDVCRRPDAYRPATHDYVCQSFTHKDVQRWLGLGLTLAASEQWAMWTGPVFATGKPAPWRLVSATEPHHLGCFAFTCT